MYEIFERLLASRNIKPIEVSKATGINSAVFSEWKRGKSTPKVDKLQKIADYFGVSLDYLLTGEEKKENEQNNEYEAKDSLERKLLLLCRKAGDVSPEDKEMVVKQFESTIEMYLHAKGIKKE